MTIKEALVKEIEDLRSSQQSRVLSYVRFLKIGMAGEDKFESAVKKVRLQARRSRITSRDIENEIKAVRLACREVGTGRERRA